MKPALSRHGLYEHKLGRFVPGESRGSDKGVGKRRRGGFLGSQGTTSAPGPLPRAPGLPRKRVRPATVLEVIRRKSKPTRTAQNLHSPREPGWAGSGPECSGTPQEPDGRRAGTRLRARLCAVPTRLPPVP